MRKNRASYIAIIPNAFTTGNLFCGTYSLFHTLQSSYVLAAYCILLAIIFDVLDGRVARVTKTESEFGGQYDSLADIVSFGVAPAIMMYSWALEFWGRMGWAVSFLYIACSALRLARFNTTKEDHPKSYFLGLATPASASMVATYVLAHDYLNWAYEEKVAILMMVALSCLKVSRVRYFNLKDVKLKSKVPVWYLVFLIFSLVILFNEPEIGAFGIVTYYVLWGPFWSMTGLIKNGFKVVFRKSV